MKSAEEASPWYASEHSVALISSISDCLLKANVPCVLWGNILVSVWGAPSISDSVDFVVPDGSLDAAVKALSGRGAAFCTEPSCYLVSEMLPCRPPAAHFHLKENHSILDPPLEIGMFIGIYLKCTTLLHVPSLVFQDQSENQVPDIILASDERIPLSRRGAFGRLYSAPSPVYVPNLHRLAESFIWDIATEKRFHSMNHSYAMMCYVALYMEDQEPLNTSLLDPRMRDFFEGMRDPSKASTTVAELETTFKSGYALERQAKPDIPNQGDLF